MLTNIKKFESKAAYEIYRATDGWDYPAVNLVDDGNCREVHYNNEFIMRWYDEDLVKVPSFFGDVSWEEFKDWVDNASRPCEVRTNTTITPTEIYYLNPEDLGEREDGTTSNIAATDWYQMAEIKNINVGLFENSSEGWKEVRFNFDKGCPKGFHKWFPNAPSGKKLWGRYDAIYLVENDALSCCANISIGGDSYSPTSFFQYMSAANNNLLSLTYWEYHVLVFIFCAYYKTFDVQSVCDGLCWYEDDLNENENFVSLRRDYPNGWIDTRVSGHAGKHILSNYSSVSGHNNEAYKFMWLENPLHGISYIYTAGCCALYPNIYYCFDDIKANAAVSLDSNREYADLIIPYFTLPSPIEVCDPEDNFYYLTLYGIPCHKQYPRNGGWVELTSSQGFYDWSYLSLNSVSNQITCVGGYYEETAGGFCRNLSTFTKSSDGKEIRYRITMNISPGSLS